MMRKDRDGSVLSQLKVSGLLPIALRMNLSLVVEDQNQCLELLIVF
jgi:hypothetical protein